METNHADDDNGDEINALTGFEQIYMASKWQQSTFKELEQAHGIDIAFHWFCVHLSNFLFDSLPSHSISTIVEFNSCKMTL